jgi:hypothetical protein
MTCAQQSEHPLTLSELMAIALRAVNDLNIRSDRFAAYAAAAIQTSEYTLSEIEASDYQAASIEMLRRLKH